MGAGAGDAADGRGASGRGSLSLREAGGGGGTTGGIQVATIAAALALASGLGLRVGTVTGHLRPGLVVW